MKRYDCLDDLKQVRRNYEVARDAIEALIALRRSRPQFFDDTHLTIDVLKSLVDELHDLYFARLFATFESILRHFWRTKIKKTKPLTRQLLDSIATQRGVPQDNLTTVHEIRQFRNSLLHEEAIPGRRWSLQSASSHLNTFLARLPLEW